MNIFKIIGKLPNKLVGTAGAVLSGGGILGVVTSIIGGGGEPGAPEGLSLTPQCAEEVGALVGGLIVMAVGNLFVGLVTGDKGKEAVINAEVSEAG